MVELSVLMIVYTSKQGILEIERITIETTSAKYLLLSRVLINNFIKYHHGLKLLAVLKFQNSKGMADFSSIPTSLIHNQNIMLQCSSVIYCTSVFFFWHVTKFAKIGEICNIFNLCKSFFAIKKVSYR